MIVPVGQKVITNLTSKKIYLAGETVPDNIISQKKEAVKVEYNKFKRTDSTKY